ncbi:MAG: hypothetical protein Q8K70_07640 [Bacteroidota bacterium]|nr:hypothetical protein [Bacteroidota bacterium]
MTKKLLVFTLFMINFRLFGLGYYPTIGAHAAGLGGSGLLIQNAFCASNNPSLMPWQKNASLGFAYNNQFLLSDVNQSHLSFVLPFKHFGYGLKCSSFGNNILKDQLIGASVAHEFHPDFSFGAGINYHFFSIRNYGSNQTTTFDFSLAANINSKLKSSFMVFNPFARKFRDIQDERMTRTFRFGIKYSINDKVFIVSEIEKNHIYKTNLKTGINYDYNKQFSFRCGISTLQPNMSFGIGFKKKNIQIETAHTYQLNLGLSNQLSFIYHFASKN